MLKTRGPCKHTTEKVPLVDQLRKKKKERKGGKVDGVESNSYYYSTIMSFYHIRSREQAKYEAVLHRSVLV